MSLIFSFALSWYWAGSLWVRISNLIGSHLYLRTPLQTPFLAGPTGLPRTGSYGLIGLHVAKLFISRVVFGDMSQKGSRVVLGPHQMRSRLGPLRIKGSTYLLPGFSTSLDSSCQGLQSLPADPLCRRIPVVILQSFAFAHSYFHRSRSFRSSCSFALKPVLHLVFFFSSETGSRIRHMLRSEETLVPTSSPPFGFFRRASLPPRTAPTLLPPPPPPPSFRPPLRWVAIWRESRQSFF